MLKIFGCECYPFIRPYQNKKLSYHSEHFIFLGYSSIHKRYKCKSLETKRIYFTSNVIFH